VTNKEQDAPTANFFCKIEMLPNKGNFMPYLDNHEEIRKLARKVLDNPQLLSKLSEKVYKLLEKDLHSQKERSRNYGKYL
jgi:hypothetical protein